MSSSKRNKYSGVVAGRDVRNPALTEKRDVFNAAAIQAEFARSLGGPPVRRPGGGKGKGRLKGKLPPGVSRATASAISKAKADPNYRSHNHTLAQRLGLKERPPDKLTPDEWDEVHERYQERTGVRPEDGGKKDVEPDCCPICRDYLLSTDQVLLSCSHSFHAACLSSFEKYVKVKVCPVCRQEQYRKKFIRDGHELYIRASAVVIQRHVRGFLTRAHVFKSLARPPVSSGLRSRFYAHKIGTVTDRYVQLANDGADDIDSLFAELDASLAHSRMIMGADIPRPCTAITAREWQVVADTATERAQSSCPICMAAFNHRDPRALLSCGHVFHQQCITAFEEYDVDYKRQCPMCREKYVRTQVGPSGVVKNETT